MIKKGDYIRKKNFEPIGKKIGILVTSVFLSRNDKILGINGFCQVEPRNIEIISKEEAERLNEIFENTSISKIINPNLNSSCIREDNGQPKYKIGNELSARIILFKNKMKNPEGNYQAYKCDTCGAFHIGKTNVV